MRVMSAGEGYRYLLRSVAAGDGARALSSPLTRYYAEVGTPPGRWFGAGVPGLAAGALGAGDPVSEEQLRLLIGEGRDPVSGAPLGRAYRRFAPLAERVAARCAALAPAFADVERVEVVARIEEAAARPARRAVAGFDFTFSVPKSASILWALGGHETRDAVEEAHRAAVADVLAFMEREVAATRVGASDGSGSVLQADVIGLIATEYDHFDSRAGDPHLHTHVVIANRAQTVGDGRWRSLDGRPLHAAVVALSELHEAVFADRLTALLGVEWEARAQGRDRNPSWAVAAVPGALMGEFSSRSRDIDAATDRLVTGYRETHGHRPAPAVVMRLRAQATLRDPAREARAPARRAPRRMAGTRGRRSRRRFDRMGRPGHFFADVAETVGRGGVSGASRRCRSTGARGGGGEAVDVDALEPARRGGEADDGLAVRDSGRPGTGGHRDRDRGGEQVGAIDAA